MIKGPSGAVYTNAATGFAKVALDGTQSFDPAGQTLRYNWQCLTADGGPTKITIDSVASPSVSLPVGTYRIQLTVSNGSTDSTPATITITVAAGVVNKPPTAVIKGPGTVVRPNPATGLGQVALDGSQSSDPDKDPLKYHWKCVTINGGTVSATIDSVARPSINLLAGTYRIELTVNDGTTDSAPAAVLVTVNTAPTADAGDPQAVYDEGNGTCRVKLDGSRSSDPEAGRGQTLVYSWTCATANPSVASGPAPSLVFPVGVHTVVLTVSDGVESSQDTTQVTVKPVVPAAQMGASPSTVGCAGTVPDVKFYLLLPASKSVAEILRIYRLATTQS